MAVYTIYSICTRGDAYTAKILGFNDISREEYRGDT